MTLRLSPELEKHLDRMVETRGVSKNQLITEAIDKYLQEMDRDRMTRDAMDWMLQHDHSLLQRLADA